jgi:RNase P subunit RPR2
MPRYSKRVSCEACKALLKITATTAVGLLGTMLLIVPCPTCHKPTQTVVPLAITGRSVSVTLEDRRKGK